MLKLQHRVRTSFDEVLETGGQIVIYGEIGHAEVNGLVGQTGGTALIVKNEEDLDKVDYSRPVYFFSQTTKSSTGFEKMRSLLEQRSKAAQQKEIQEEFLSSNDTICSDTEELHPEWLENAESVGICGATSTPMWLMEKVSAFISESQNAKV